jgi:hypothetical protein
VLPKPNLGFIPTLNFRYGKSYSRAADDSAYEYETNKHRRLQMAQEEVDRMFRAKSAPRMTSIRSKDEVQQALDTYIEKRKFQGRYQGIFFNVLQLRK